MIFQKEASQVFYKIAATIRKINPLENSHGGVHFYGRCEQEAFSFSKIELLDGFP